MAGEIQDFRLTLKPRSMHLAMYSVVEMPSCLARSSADRFNSSSIHKLIWRLSLSLTFGIKIGCFHARAGGYEDTVKKVKLILHYSQQPLIDHLHIIQKSVANGGGYIYPFSG
jgi:hypothetical protein